MVNIPNRPVFRAQEVCELAEVQPYVLRTWEAEFPDLGVAKSANAPRVYRRADVERVLRIKHLLFVDGLTLAGARRRLSEEGFSAPEEPLADGDLAAMLESDTRRELRNVRLGLQWILGVLSGDGLTPVDYVLRPPVNEPRGTSGRAASREGRASTKAARPSAKKSAPRGKRR